MKTIGLFLCGIVVIAMLCNGVFGGSCGTVYPSYSYGYQQSYYTPTYYEPEYRKKVILEYQLVPLFAVGYAGQYAAPPAAAPAATQAVGVTPCEETARKLQARLDAIEAKLGGEKPPVTYAPRKEEAPAPPPMAPVTGPPTAGTKAPQGSVLFTSCASCHESATASSKGKGVVLFVGDNYAKWDSATTGKVLKAISTGHMPPGGGLTPELFNRALQELVTLQDGK